ncbi:MAG: hypothetical protein WCL44_12660 [bacterium]
MIRTRSSPVRTNPQASRLLRLSMSFVGARAQFVMAVALVTVIPALIMVYLLMSGRLGFQIPFRALVPVIVLPVPFVALGYWMLAKYPANVIRLRQYLENIVNGVVPAKVELLKDEDDLASIEMLMREVIRQTETRIQTIEKQTEALLEAERQRVMIQSLGAACHHIGQPATVINSYLQLLQGVELPQKEKAMLAECRIAAESVASVLDRLQCLTVYRTESYVQHGNMAPGGGQAEGDIVRL